MFFDTHAHYYDEQFDDDRDALISSMAADGVDNIVIPADTMASCHEAIALAERYPFIYAAVGIHPENIAEMTDDTIDTLRKLAAHKKVVAIGEIGLDYYWDKEHKSEQKKYFKMQLDLARELNLPVIIHERDACGDTLEIIKDYSDIKGVMHCFSGSLETAKFITDMDWYISFTGVVTFKNARRSVEVAAQMPIERLMLETDSPYLAPVPNRGKRNDSRNLKYIAEKIASERGVSVEELAKITSDNAHRFFGIK